MAWLPKESVVVPVDFSDLSFEAVETALGLVENASHLAVIHVLPSLEPAEPGVIWSTIDDDSRARHAEEALRERLSGPTYKGIQVHVVIGDPGHEVAEFAQHKQADLIVMPSHGHRSQPSFDWVSR